MPELHTVEVTRYVTPLREGGSLPAIADADDGFQYVLKFRGAGQGTRALIADCAIVAAHVFPYSPRPGTPAARMPQVPHDAIKRRASRLRDVAAARRAAWLQGLIGTRATVLIENNEKGHSDGFAPVRISGAARGAISEGSATSGRRLKNAPWPARQNSMTTTPSSRNPSPITSGGPSPNHESPDSEFAGLERS